MALLYRAIWRDQRSDLLAAGAGTFQTWIESKNIDLSVPDEGMESDGAQEVAVARVADDGVEALRIRLNEERSIGGDEERWTTTAHWMTDGEDGWAWVDLEWVSDNAFNRRPDIAAPNLVRLLLEADGAERGRARLGPTPARVSSTDVEELVAWLYDDDRSVPVVVFSVDATIGPAGYSARVKETARRLAGCADVRMLTADSESAFDATMRDTSLSVFDGAARVYLPGIAPTDPKPWRHRYIRAYLLTDRPQTAAARISRLVLPRMVAQRPPALYRTHVKQLLDSASGDTTDWEAMALELDESASRLEQENNDLREEKDLALMEALESELRAADALQRLEALRAKIRVAGDAPDLVEQEAGEATTAGSCAEAVALADGLDHVVVHPDAPRDLERMDESPDSELWGQRVWSHLQVLNAYAIEKGPGFKIWCETSGRLSSKFLSMTESETVRNNRRLRDCRVLPVSEQVDASGQIEMFAHIKSIQGGGMQIPRIYFHDDTKGRTGNIHVGFIGPHDLMPNTLTN